MDEDILSTDFISVNQNNDEAEELEDRKLREEEIHNLLSHAMDEFDFDDHSSNCSTDGDNSVLSNRTQVEYNEQYREADINDQLKILYEVRVREVAALNDEIAKTKAQFLEQKQNLKKKLILLEADNQQKNISLKESHELLVEKSENIKNLNDEVGHLKTIIRSLENGVSEVKQENMLLQDSNMKLEQQITIMERGFPLQNKFADKEMQEMQKNKIVHLEADLEKMIGQLEHKEKQHKESLRELKEELQEKTNLLCEKDSVISILSENFNSAQQHCSELSHTIEELKTLKPSEQKGSPLEEELRKIREQNERTEIITQNVRKIVSQEYENQAATLRSENISLKQSLELKETELKNLQEQLQEISSLKIKHESLLNEASGLQEKIKSVEIERDSFQVALNNLQRKYHSLDDERTILQAEVNDCKNNLEKLKIEYLVCHKRALELETLVKTAHKPVTLDTSIQTSLSMNNTEVDRLNKVNQELHNRLVSAQSVISRLQNDAKLLAEENLHLKERENLIKSLQQKAEQFERILYEKQKALENVKTATVGVNTDAFEDGSILKIKYDALLYQTETKLRKMLKKEFDGKLEKFVQQTLKDVKAQQCGKCATLTTENKKLQELRTEERVMVIKLVDMWAQKFSHLEKESDRKLKDLNVAYSQRLVIYVTKLEQEYNEKFQKFSRQFQQDVVQELKRQKTKVGGNIHRPDLLNERLERIMAKIEKGNEKVVAIETQYSHRKDLERA